jgi:hypothetical protein
MLAQSLAEACNLRRLRLLERGRTDVAVNTARQIADNPKTVILAQQFKPGHSSGRLIAYDWPACTKFAH